MQSGMDRMVFDSRNLSDKAPYGAVTCHTEIFFTLRPLTAEGFLSCSLVFFREFADVTEEIPLSPAGTEKDRSLFTGSITMPEEPDLCWYHFRFVRKSGETVYLGKSGYHRGDKVPDPWQQTVYDGSLDTPDWFGRGVTYQIFPDRFRRAGPAPDASGMLGHRVVHQDWEEMMELPEEQGIFANRDFYGGSLAGIEEKLEYLHSLHVSTIYLCPVFESDSNHRYNTGDYEKIDPMLGTEEDFRRLCEKAKALGIRVMLDGVFNHTGNNSRYFNAQGSYPGLGAAQSRESPYFSWYTFQEWPQSYESWWGFPTLPSVNEMNEDYIAYIIEGHDSIIRRWLRAGAEGWRLDVADELPDVFIEKIRKVMMEEKPDSLLIGEVWEDGSNKIAYEQRRRYLLGRETHGLMNYPFRVEALRYLQSGDAEKFQEAMEQLRENYPPDAFYSAMNMLSTHDTPRALTMLGEPSPGRPESRQERRAHRLTEEQYRRGCRLLAAGAVLMYAFPGSPTVFYGDEAGMQGYEDPMNRGTYPWGKEDTDLLEWYRMLGRLRDSRLSLQIGSLRWIRAKGRILVFTREWENEITVAAINAGDEPDSVALDWLGERAEDALSGYQFTASDGQLDICLPPLTGMLIV